MAAQLRKRSRPRSATPPKKRGGQSKYSPEQCARLVAHMASGFSYTTFGPAAGVTRKTVANWEAEHPDFAEARQEGEHALQLYFEREAQRLQGGGKGNIVAFIWRSKNVAKWRDATHHEHTGKDSGPIVLEVKQ